MRTSWRSGWLFRIGRITRWTQVAANEVLADVEAGEYDGDGTQTFWIVDDDHRVGVIRVSRSRRRLTTVRSPPRRGTPWSRDRHSHSSLVDPRVRARARAHSNRGNYGRQPRDATSTSPLRLREGVALASCSARPGRRPPRRRRIRRTAFGLTEQDAQRRRLERRGARPTTPAGPTSPGVLDRWVSRGCGRATTRRRTRARRRPAKPHLHEGAARATTTRPRRLASRSACT